MKLGGLGRAFSASQTSTPGFIDDTSATPDGVCLRRTRWSTAGLERNRRSQRPMGGDTLALLPTSSPDVDAGASFAGVCDG